MTPASVAQLALAPAAPAGSCATWTKQRGPDHPAAGRKTLWVWCYGRGAEVRVG